MLNEEQLTVKQIQRRLIGLMSSTESFQNYLTNLCKISERSPVLQSVVGATLEYLLLMTEGAAVLQLETDRSYWTSGSARLRNLRGHWRTAYESLHEWNELAEPDQVAEDDCECEESDPLISPY